MTPESPELAPELPEVPPPDELPDPLAVEPEEPEPEPELAVPPELEPEEPAEAAAAPVPDPDPELHAAPRTKRQGANCATARNRTAMVPLAVDCTSRGSVE